MTSEEMERAISFLLNSQAKHDAQIGELRDRVAELSKQVGEVAEQVSGLAEQVSGLAERVGEINHVILLQSGSQSQFNETVTNAITSLIESQRRTDERLAGTDGRIDRMVEAAARADARLAEAEELHARRYDEIDARLDRLVGVVERLVEKDRGA